MRATRRLAELLGAAEGYEGTSGDWNNYADALERYVVPVPHVLVDSEEADDQPLTEEAKAFAATALRSADPRTGQFITFDDEGVDELVFVEARAHEPGTELIPLERLALLYRLEAADIPVLVALYSGRWHVAWLRDLPDGWTRTPASFIGSRLATTFNLETLPPIPDRPRRQPEPVGDR